VAHATGPRSHASRSACRSHGRCRTASLVLLLLLYRISRPEDLVSGGKDPLDGLLIGLLVLKPRLDVVAALGGVELIRRAQLIQDQVRGALGLELLHAAVCLVLSDLLIGDVAGDDVRQLVDE